MVPERSCSNLLASTVRGSFSCVCRAYMQGFIGSLQEADRAFMGPG